MKITHRLLTAAALTLVVSACTTPPAPVSTVSPPAVLPVAQLERGVQIVLPDTVLFETGKADIHSGQAQAYLERIAYLLITKTEKIVSVEGHTDNVGSTAYNQKLSEQRALAVKKVLLDLKVPEQRIVTLGYAYQHPVASNATEEGRKFNRRTELIVLDEKLENMTRGEAANSFEAAFSRLKGLIEQGLLQAPDK
ncbi:OmpA family protein [Undibacterium rugosum]|uniref:OmpA family protein n=1 Tax=Undibacterium rugosum TaxID=2762291 RepID=UPI001B83DB68|nr:OmpA family protein [Undibacterium rugosum]MBR7777704.1 OmpA family protein [Undibacterium rugosum]